MEYVQPGKCVRRLLYVEANQDEIFYKNTKLATILFIHRCDMVPNNIVIYLSMNFSSIVQNYYVYFAYVYKELSVMELCLRHFGATPTNPPIFQRRLVLPTFYSNKKYVCFSAFKN